MSHGDTIVKLGSKLQVLAKSEFGSIALYKHKNKNIYGTQFHPEVVHTPFGKRFLSNFIFFISSCKNNWRPGKLIKLKTSEIKELVGKNKVISAISGGVDSSLVAFLMQKNSKKKN